MTTPLGRSFGAAAGDYSQLRPPLPEAALDWLVPHGLRAAVDLGAGPGVFTRRLAERVPAVYAVEPDQRFHEALRRNCPAVTVLTGTAEDVPLPGASVDAVFAAASWHWFDPVAAAAEAARILRPGGTLAVAWNQHDTDVPWMAELRAITASTGFADPEPFELSPGAPFDAPGHLDLRNTLPMRRAEIVRMIGTYSPVIALPGRERDRLLRRVSRLLATHPGLADRDIVDVPMRALCWRTTRTPCRC